MKQKGTSFSFRILSPLFLYHFSFMLLVEYAPSVGAVSLAASQLAGPVDCAVENLSYKKESWINSRRQHKRHVSSEWQHGHASRAVDGDADRSLHSCIALDNFYVERPTLRIDLGKRTQVSGLIIVTWQGKGQGQQLTSASSGIVSVSAAM